MPFMQWSDKLSVSVAILDNDHKRLIELINELHDAMLAGRGKEALSKILDGLIAYTIEHFRREEGMLVNAEYPDLSAHRKEHEKLTQQVRDIQKKYLEGKSLMISMEVMTFLKDWLANHIQGTDKKYSVHLNGKGMR
jgi:hemerythrin-like metal-binding protein